MRRMIVAVIILLLLTGGWMWEKKTIDTACDEMTKKLESVSIALSKSDTQRLMELTADLEKAWKRNEKILDMLTPHDDTDEINLNLVRLECYVEEENFPAIKIVIKEMDEHFREIEEKLKVNYTNIF